MKHQNLKKMPYLGLYKQYIFILGNPPATGWLETSAEPLGTAGKKLGPCGEIGASDEDITIWGPPTTVVKCVTL